MHFIASYSVSTTRNHLLFSCLIFVVYVAAIRPSAARAPVCWSILNPRFICHCFLAIIIATGDEMNIISEKRSHAHLTNFIWESRCHREFGVGTLYVLRVTARLHRSAEPNWSTRVRLSDSMTLNLETTCSQITSRHLSRIQQTQAFLTVISSTCREC